MLRGLARSKHSLSRSINEILANPSLQQGGAPVTIKGHIRAVKSMKSHGFLDVSDGTTSQALNILLTDPNLLSEHKLKVGQSVELNCNFVPSQVKENVNEVHCDSVKVIGNVPDRYPIQKKATSMEFLRTLPTLRHRTATLSSIFRFRSFLEGKFTDFFRDEQFVKVSPPILTSSDCEGAGELFYVGSKAKKNFFKKNAYLTVSTQLHLEVLVPSLNRVWTLTPCFRAENSDTNRHLSEFWMLEVEMSYVEHVNQLTYFSQRMIQYVVKQHQQSTSQNAAVGDYNDMHTSFRDLERKANLESKWKTLEDNGKLWPSITYKEALEIVNENDNKFDTLAWGDSLSTEHEKWLAGSHFKGPVFITDYPKEQKPFYMSKSSPEVYDPEKPTVACYDLILPEIGELIGGSLRIHDYEELKAEMESRGMDTKDLQWYLDLRKYGTVPHGGFGMGFERLIMYLSTQENIRDVISFPRYPEHIKC